MGFHAITSSCNSYFLKTKFSKHNKEHICHFLVTDSAQNNSCNAYVLQDCNILQRVFFLLLFSAHCGSAADAWFPQSPSGRCEPGRGKGRNRRKRRRRTQNAVNFNKHNVLIYLFWRSELPVFVEEMKHW